MHNKRIVRLIPVAALLLLLTLTMAACAGTPGAETVVSDATEMPAPTETTAPTAMPEPTEEPDPTEAPDPTDTPASADTAELPACADPDVTVTVAVAALTFADVYLAQRAGMFEEYGLDVTLVNTQGGGPDLAALISGDAQFNLGFGSYQIDAIAQGQEQLRSVYVFLDGSPLTMVLSHEAADAAGVTADSPLEDRIEALRGRTIGATRPGAATFLTAEAVLRKGGMEPQVDAEIVGIGGGDVLIAALAQGEIDAFILAPPVPQQAVAEDLGIELISVARGDIPELDPVMSQMLYVRDDYIEDHPGCIQRFIWALRDASDFIVENDAATVAEIVAPDFGTIDRNVLEQAVVSIQDSVAASGELTPVMVENTLRMRGQDSPSAETVLNLWDGQFVDEE